jgi:membrane-associated protease RseP (regulator of RpoE activity)
MAAMNSVLRGADLGLWFNTRPGMNGLVIADVANQGAFANAGFRENDRIVSVNGHPVTTEAQFVQALSSPNAGQTANIVVDRNGIVQTLAVQPSAVMRGVATFDPLFQAGVTLNNTDPNHLVVSQVFPRTPAFYAGLRPGDVINQINGNPISSPIALSQALAGGGILNMQVNRNGQTRQLGFESIDNGLRTAMLPGTSRNGVQPGQINLSTGANTVNQVDQSGLNTTGTISSATSTTAPTTVPSTSATLPIPGAQNSSTPFAPAGPTNASAIGTPGPTLTTSPGNLSANQSAPTGLSTANPGFTGPSQLPSANATPSVGGTGISGLGTSGLSPANPAQTAIGTAGAAGATGTTGGTGSTAGGIGAVGGTGAMIGGTGSTAGPSGGSTATGAIGGAAGAAGSGTGGAGAAGGSAGGGAASGGT